MRHVFLLSSFVKVNYHRPVGVFAVAAGLQTISLGYSTTEFSNFYATETNIFLQWEDSYLNQMVMGKSEDKKV